MSTIVSEAESFIAGQYEDQDPSVANGYTIFFNREIRYKVDGADVIYRTRILNLFDENKKLTEVRFELFNDDDIDFLYDSSVAANEYDQFKQENQLTIPFEQFANSVKSLLENSVKNPTDYECKFAFSDEGATISFFQKLRLRKVEIFELAFTKSDPEFIKDQAQSRFNRYKFELSQKKAEYDRIISKICERNPSIAERIDSAVIKLVEEKTGVKLEKSEGLKTPRSPKKPTKPKAQTNKDFIL